MELPKIWIGSRTDLKKISSYKECTSFCVLARMYNTNELVFCVHLFMCKRAPISFHRKKLYPTKILLQVHFMFLHHLIISWPGWYTDRIKTCLRCPKVVKYNDLGVCVSPNPTFLAIRLTHTIFAPSKLSNLTTFETTQPTMWRTVIVGQDIRLVVKSLLGFCLTLLSFFFMPYCHNLGRYVILV